MQTTMSVEDIKLTLPELLDKLTAGDEVILTRNQCQRTCRSSRKGIHDYIIASWTGQSRRRRQRPARRWRERTTAPEQSCSLRFILSH